VAISNVVVVISNVVVAVFKFQRLRVVLSIEFCDRFVGQMTNQTKKLREKRPSNPEKIDQSEFFAIIC
jgi:hypothetical protein